MKGHLCHIIGKWLNSVEPWVCALYCHPFSDSLCQNPVCHSHNPASSGWGWMIRGRGAALLGTFLSQLVPCPPWARLARGKAKLGATWVGAKLSFIHSCSDLFSVQCKFPCLKTWSLV